MKAMSCISSQLLYFQCDCQVEYDFHMMLFYMLSHDHIITSKHGMMKRVWTLLYVLFQKHDLFVPYVDLKEEEKDNRRVSVRAVINSLTRKGYRIRKCETTKVTPGHKPGTMYIHSST